MKISVIIRPKYGWFPTSNSYRSSDVTTPQVVVVWQMMSKWTRENNNKINLRQTNIAIENGHL